MRTQLIRLLTALVLCASLHRAAAQGTAFTYQGRLDNGTNPVNGSYDLTFALYSASSGGSQTGSTITNLAVGVTNGLFVVTNDFGSVYSGTPYWLQIGVRTNGAATFQSLSPRQELTPTPYAVYAESSAATALVSDPGTQNFFAGSDAGNAASPGAYNTGVGNAALNVNTGSYNSALGNDSLAANTTGDANTAEGVFALWKNTTGANNTAIGADVMAYNQTGNFNTAIGTGALENGTVGSNNVAVGAYALLNSTEWDTVAVGYQALENDVAGGLFPGGNTAVGYTAMQADTTGFFNTAIGFGALAENTNGAENVATGLGALEENLSGNNNTAYGFSALSANTTGTGNIAIGSQAGVNITTGSSNIYIGNAGVSSDNNIIRIGTPGIQTQTYVSGQFYCNVITIQGGSDLAEPFEVSSAAAGEIPEGSVVVIDEENPGHLKLSNRPYDTRVAGVLSGANGVHPGIQMQQQGLLEGGKNVALTGRVYVQADTSNGAIKPGDLLTTSSTPGRAMKVRNHAKAEGAILGKAMTGLKDGEGMVLVLVTLQ
jgi:hypothetical protein